MITNDICILHVHIAQDIFLLLLGNQTVFSVTPYYLVNISMALDRTSKMGGLGLGSLLIKTLVQVLKGW